MNRTNSTFKTQNSPFATRRGLLVPAIIGLAVVLCATLLIPWPSDIPGQPRALLVPHIDRLLYADDATPLLTPDPAGFTLGWVWRRVWDVTHYLLIVAAGGLITAALLRPARWPWLGLLAVGGLGAIYTAGMVLYNGPLVATPGYLLIALPSLFAVLTWRGNPSPQRAQRDAEDTEEKAAEQRDLATTAVFHE